MIHAKKSLLRSKVATRRPAYSLIFAFLIMTVIMLVAGTTIENTHDKVIYFREIEGTAQARLAAESAAELAVMEIRGEELGYDPAYGTTTTGDGVFCLEYDTTSTTSSVDYEDYCKAWASYDVRSVAETNSNDSSSSLFYTPIPGTGSAGLEDECSILDSDLDPDHPCNWNKLMYGQSVTVPLYAFDSSYGSGTYTPASLAIRFNDWYLKVRTPCVDEYEEGCTRYVFPGTAFNPYSTYDADDDGIYTPSIEDPSVILWQLLGEDSNTGVGYQVLPDDETDSYGSGDDTFRSYPLNTEISQSDINNDELVLELSTHSDIQDICSNTSLDSLVLQLDIVSLLVDSDGNSIPYLEWQFVTDSYYPFATNEMSVVGSGYYEGEPGTFYFPYVISRSSTGESTNIYTLSN